MAKIYIVLGIDAKDKLEAMSKAKNIIKDRDDISIEAMYTEPYHENI